MDKDDAERRQTGAYDADIDFDIRPVDDICLIPCWISRGGEADEWS